ncbi:hypothetical protein [Daejeonella sp. H1SJ63]|uniref:hypothetical protein n=1 Tax=Daejeonella sp. H1SJ63 TaxID=3034145 RepID=UPI0023EC0142|nr:hypothetical protein [Daejeonella sp. H1SJ63]
MEKLNVKDLGMQEMNSEEMYSCTGGETPGMNTSLANDIGYMLAYGFFGAIDMVRAFGAGAAKGQKLRFQG